MSDERPYYALHVFCCTNERPEGHPRGSCARKGAERLRNYMKARAKELGIPGTRINAAGCLDRCELGATLVVYPDGVWYTYANEADLDEILTVHLQGGRVVDRLRLAVDQKELRPEQVGVRT
ncbi:MAG: (2Fe-2S) ferredoxin domain-containing protein [Rhodospirillales bacterium]